MASNGFDTTRFPGAAVGYGWRSLLDRWLAQGVDAALAGSVFVLPLLLAGRHPLGKLVLVVLAGVAGVSWSLRGALRQFGKVRRSAAAPLFLAGMALVAVQIIPWPEPVLTTLSPELPKILPLWYAHGGDGAALGTWSTISLTPLATREALALWMAYAILFGVAVQRIASLSDVERLLRWCAVAACLMAAFGLVQFFTTNGKFFWFYQHPYKVTSDCVKGSFENRNHFAQFLALGLGPLIWWIQDGLRRRSAAVAGTWAGRSRPGGASPTRTPYGPPHQAGAILPAPSGGVPLGPSLLIVMLGLVWFAGLLSLSRGGVAAMFLATTIAGAIGWRFWSQARSLLIAAGAAAGLLIAALVVFGYDRVSSRMSELTSGSVEQWDPGAGRRAIWMAGLRAIAHFPWLGSGVGSHAQVYPLFFPHHLRDTDRQYTHAECSYLQLGLETGVVGLGLLLMGMACCAAWCWRAMRQAQSGRAMRCVGAVVAGLAASAAHALVDFIWYVPACVVVVLLLAACACRLSVLSGRDRQGRAFSAGVGRRKADRGAPGADADAGLAPASARRPHPSAQTSPPDSATCPAEVVLPRSAFLALAASLLVAGAWMTWTQVGPAVAALDWDRYRIARQAFDAEPRPWEAASPLTESARLGAQQAEARRIGWLHHVVRWNPDFAQAHLELAECYLRLFDLMQLVGENPMSVANVRDAVLRSRFSSRAELEAWLGRGIGEHAEYLTRALRHTRRAVAGSPLEGRAYLYLAELCFLENRPEAAKRAYVDQALRVRPTDGEVLYAAATEALLEGDLEAWFDRARRAFQSGRRHQMRLMADLLTRTPAEALPEMIQLIVHEFEPDLAALRELHRMAERRGSPEQLAWLRQHYAERAEAMAQGTRHEAAALLWNEARVLRTLLGQPERALACAESAVACDPTSFDARYGLASALGEAGRWAEAEPHWRWCLRQRPHDAAIEAKWKQALRGRLEQPARTAHRKPDAPRS